MLRISKPLNSGKLQSYHALEYTSPAQSYYQHGDRVKGEWQGQLAPLWGLAGEVTPQEFTRLSEGQHPLTGDQLVKHRKPTEYTTANGATVKAVAHRAGWDATFSPSKSVSLTALVGGDDRIREAHRDAVTTALTELEKYTQARLGGNHPAETTGKFLVAKFEHDTARPVDGYAAPQLHTHAVIFNVTERTNGTTRALDADSLFESQQYATAIYQSELMYSLRSLGYEIERGRSGAPEIKGYTQEYLDVSSQRHSQIEEALAKVGAHGHEAAEIAAHATRERKQQLTPGQVLAAHREVAESFGNQSQQVVAQAHQHAQRYQHKPDRETHAREALTYARSSLFEREAVADERLIFRDALRRGMGETTYAEVRTEFESRRQSGNFRSVETGKYASGRSFTTPETIAAEHSNVAFMRSGQNALRPILTAEAAQRQANSVKDLNSSQRRVVEEVLNSPDRVHGLQGRAGVGKTEVLKTIRTGAEHEGFLVEGFAPTSRAAAQLRDANIPATTLQSFLARGAQPPNRSVERHLYMLDEASLASTRQMRSFFDRLRPDDRVLVIGDIRQHQAVDAGRPFQQLQDAGMRTSQLDKIMRQKDADLLRAVEHLSRNETQQGIDLLRQQGKITEVPHHGERITAIARDYASTPERTLIVSPDNKSRQEINQTVRQALREQGHLPREETTLRTLAHRSDMTGTDRTWAARYNINDVVQYTTGSQELGLNRNSIATVRAVNGRSNILTVEREDGTSVSYDPRRLRGVHVFQEVERAFSVRDRIQFTAPQKGLAVANRELGTIIALENGRMRVALDGGNRRTIEFDPKDIRQFDHGYAVTSHSSQGLTTTRVVAHFDTEGPRNLVNTRLAYVAISRASHDAQIYTNDIATLGRRLSSDVTKSTALEFHTASASRNVQPAVAAFRTGDTATGMKLLQQQQRIHRYATFEQRLSAIAADYVAHPEHTVVVMSHPQERHRISSLIREELLRRGTIRGESLTVPVSIPQDFGMGRLASRYAPGDRIAYKSGNAELGLADHSEVIILRIDKAANHLTVATKDGNEVTYNPALTRRMTGQSQIFREESREFAAGDRIRFIEKISEHHIRSGSFATVVAIDDSDTMRVQLDNGKNIQLTREQTGRIDYGYAVGRIEDTSQGRVLLAGIEHAPATRLQSTAMTNLSPHTHDLAIYTVDAQGRTLNHHLPTPDKGLSAMDRLSQLSEPSKLPTATVDLEGIGIGR